MKILENISLAPFTTLCIGGPAKYFVEVRNLEELEEALTFAKEKDLPVFILGGGSNVLVSDEGFPGVVIRIGILGKEVAPQDLDEIRIRVGAGEVLDEVIAWSVENGWWGMENLSFIPGRVGALVIQNVNAYGAKAEQIVEHVEVLDRKEGHVKKISKEECKFRYRGSIFNKEEKDRYVVLSVGLRLQKFGTANTGYVDVRKRLARAGIGHPSLKQMREMVIHIRKGKGFDPEKNPSAGSFFSNIMLTKDESQALRDKIRMHSGEELAQKYDEIVQKFYEAGEVDPHLETGKIKIPTGFLLDQVLGLKGQALGGAQVSNMHAQTLFNAGTATAHDLLALSNKIKKIVFETLGVRLVNEPEFVGFSEEELAI